MTNEEMERIAKTIGNDGKWKGGSKWLVSTLGGIGGAGAGTAIALLSGFGSATVITAVPITSTVAVGGILGWLGFTGTATTIATVTSTVLYPAVLIPVAIATGVAGIFLANKIINEVYKQGIRIGGIQQALKDKILLERYLEPGYYVKIRETKKGADLIVSKEEIIDLKDRTALRNAFVIEY
ncbi:MAG: hypothetical protein LBJ67_06720 [Planctomycetaceae bacterium]|jgi:hypothetical protein|nr:hypothetical protein [Planctomycetaceae bacterium]